MKKLIVKSLRKLVQLVEWIEYRHRDIDMDDVDKKILNSVPINFKVKTDTGMHEASYLHLTQPFLNYRIITENHALLGADTHILFDENMSEVFMKDLKVGDKIQTKQGIETIEKIEKNNLKSSMFDLSIDHTDRRFFTNDLLSHNTITSAIFMVHTIVFNNEKNIMIVANKGDTAVEIVDKIKSIYTLLPFFLKPGIKTWNQKSLTFENKCRIKTSARSKTPAIGFTIDVLYLDEFAHIPSNIIEPYYTAAFPTVAAVQNSKIIITSTPNGMNLFHRLLTEAELPEGDPKKNNYKAHKVYWYEVPGRFVTYMRLSEHKLYDFGVTRDDIYDLVKNQFPNARIEMKYSTDVQKWVIYLHMDDDHTEEMYEAVKFTCSKGNEYPIQAVAELTTWKKEAIKDIGGEDAFNQEFGLRFINSSKSLLTEYFIDTLIKNVKLFEFRDIPTLENNLRFTYKDLKWREDFNMHNIKNRYFLFSIDLSEGLGQDYSVINIFEILPKSKENIEANRPNINTIHDFAKLEQVGIFHSNIISIKQISELFYHLAFSVFDPEKCKAVLEINGFGSTLLSELPHINDGMNDYSKNIFLKYKHRVDAEKTSIGFKVTDSSKKLAVKSYQEKMNDESFSITEPVCINEITKFVKHTTASGNTTYGADSGHDDTTMTIVNASTAFGNSVFKNLIEECLIQNHPEFYRYAISLLDNYMIDKPNSFESTMGAMSVLSNFLHTR